MSLHRVHEERLRGSGFSTGIDLDLIVAVSGSQALSTGVINSLNYHSRMKGRELNDSLVCDVVNSSDAWKRIGFESLRALIRYLEARENLIPEYSI